MRTLAYWLALLLIFTVPWEAVVEDPTLGSLPKLIGLVLAACWAAAVATTGRLRKPTPFHGFVLLLLVWNAISIFWSANADRTFEHLLTWLQLAVMVFILWDLLDSQRALSAALQMYVLGGYVVLGNTILNYMSGKTFYYERFSAVGTNPDDLGIVLALGIPIAWYLTSPKNNRPQPLVLKVINYVYIPAALLGIALSGTRTALVAVLPAVIFLVASVTRLSIWAKIGITLLFAAAMFVITPIIPQASFDRLGTTSTEVFEGNWNGRLDLWAQGLESFEKSPIVGVGSNMYRSVNREFKVAHNSFLSVLVELGLVGFALFAFTLVIVLVQAARHPPWDAAFWFSVLAVWAIGALTLTWEYRKPTWLFLCLVIVSAALAAEPRQEAVTVPGSRYEPISSQFGQVVQFRRR